MCATLLVIGCSGGDGGTDAVPCTTLSFNRTLGTPADGDVYLDQTSATCTTVDIGVVVANLGGVFTTGFDIAYPADILEYGSYTLGPLLLKDNPLTTPTVIALDTGGTVQISITRWNPDAEVSAVGSEVLISLRFARVAPGAGAVDFDISGTSTVGEIVLDDGGSTSPASFGPGHGGMVTVP